MNFISKFIYHILVYMRGKKSTFISIIYICNYNTILYELYRMCQNIVSNFTITEIVINYALILI